MDDERAEMAQRCDSLMVEGYETNYLREEAVGKRRKMEEGGVASLPVKEVEEAEVLKMALGEEAKDFRTRSTSYLSGAEVQEPLLPC